MTALNILHVFRAPVGGLFRHVRDLARAQAERGHRVGLIADSNTGGEHAKAFLDELAPFLALGLSRVPMQRTPGLGDIAALRHVAGRAAETSADIVHGHGAKGGAYARLCFGAPRAVRVYTPHGGSLLFGHDTLAGRIYLGTERLLMRRGDLFLFESEYSAAMFRRKIGEPSGAVRVVHNGVSRDEFEPIVPLPDATDLVFLGEMRLLKGVDVLIEAVAQLRRDGRSVTATLVGDGPDRAVFVAQVEKLNLGNAIRFMPAMSARQAQPHGRLMVAPSRQESLPYVVLETAAAAMPLITTNVGGIPEIYGPLSDRLVPPGDAPALAHAIATAMDDPAGTADAVRRLQQRVATSFSIESMVEGVLAAYQTGLEALHKNGRR
ncbi:MAG: glycosyltransferase family 4 protein [Pseudolabrys sp.]|nr:glycosyltransferase family 4 protein [Pseudolabrys sp.]